MLEELLFIMMGLKCLNELDYRIVLWRNTIQLFYEYKRPKFIGPFKAAGLAFHVEPFCLSSEKGNSLTPDIVASGESGWIILELTTKSKSKEPNLSKYKSIDSRDLGVYGLSTHDGEPDILTSRLSIIDDGPYCQIIVKDVLEIRNEESILNQHLKNELINAKGTDLKKIPEIPITLLPEMKSKEIRRGLIEIIMQLFEPNSEGRTLVQLVDDGLERLSDKIGPTSRRKLISKVKNEMDFVIKNHLSEYLELENEKYRPKEKFKQHHKTMGTIASKLKDWAGPSPQTTLSDWQKSYVVKEQ